MKYKFSTLLLAVFLIIWGAAMALSLVFQGMNVVLGALAIAAGICLLIDR
jgi:hypothetical protein